MASTITLTGDWMVSLGNRRQTSGTGNLGTYATSGIAVSAGQVGLGVVDAIVIDPAGGYVFSYVKSTGKVLAYVGGGATAAHTHDLLIKGGQAAATTARTAHYATDIFGKEAATDATIAGADSATKGGVIEATASGTAGTEVTTGTNLSGITFNWRAVGI